MTVVMLSRTCFGYSAFRFENRRVVLTAGMYTYRSIFSNVHTQKFLRSFGNYDAGIAAAQMFIFNQRKTDVACNVVKSNGLKHAFGAHSNLGHLSTRCYSSDRGTATVDGDGTYRDPWKTVKDVIIQDGSQHVVVPGQTDMLIIGGGAIGLSVAYWMKARSRRSYTVTVVERDPCYTRAATVLSVGGIRQQFSLPENIRMSMFQADFLRNIKEHLSVLDLDPPDVQFNPQGYLFLATEAGVDCLKRNHETQTGLGAKVELIPKESLARRFPWLSAEDIELGSYGLQNEGWLDPWLLLAALKAKCLSLGVRFVQGEVIDLSIGSTASVHQGRDGLTPIQQRNITQAKVKAKDGQVYPMEMAQVVNCGGPWAGQVGRMAGIGTGDGPLQHEIPVEPRKRYVFMFHCPDGPGLEMPMLIDPSGVYVRREGMAGHYICGVSPADDSEEPPTDNLDVDYELFNEKVWPVLASRVPAFEKLKVKSAWAGYYDYNYYDQNLLIGNHPVYKNFHMACGSSGHGIQHCIAIGRAVTEWVLDGDFQTINLSQFLFDRVMYGQKVLEENIV